MPRYEYEPIDCDPERLREDPSLRERAAAAPCDLCGGRFEFSQGMREDPLAECPLCDRPVRRRISLPSVQVARSDAELRDLGFTKLARRSDGSYENVTARPGEPRIVDPNQGRDAP